MTPAHSVRIELQVLGQRMAVDAPRPPDLMRLDEGLPVLREIDNRVIDLAVAKVTKEGQTVSCCRGCSACCRAQPVPVTPPEAYALLRLVEEMPESRREKVRRRFADRLERLRAAGLANVFLDRNPPVSPEQARAIAERYFKLGLVCPFLEDDACGIYADRPFVCRQYLVTSPASLCADPFHNPISIVPMPLMPATATLKASEELLGTPQYTVPLVLALEYARTHRSELERVYPAHQIMQKWLAALAKPE